MVSVNSISGGKSSAYMAYHYPADYNVFALVLIDDNKCSPNDKGLIKRVSEKIGKDFIATAEDDKTIKAVLDLEQMMGKEIKWLTGISFDNVNKLHKSNDGRYGLPNQMWRYCTTEMKMKPIFEWWRANFTEPILMRVGFRYDEAERADRFTEVIRAVVGKTKNGTKNRWDDFMWRKGDFPLIADKVLHYHVKKWVDSTGLDFPQDSNCVGCFWKPIQQLRKNWDDNPQKMEWFAQQERDRNRRFKREMSYDKIKTVGLQSEFMFGTGSGCQAGFCTD
jgi:hypothetical protein